MSDIINSVIAPDSTESLDFSRAYNYALAYWCDRNYDYNYYEGMNCQNFVSQIFLAAGFPTSSSFKNGTYAFINVDGFLDYMRAKGVAYTSGRPSVSNVKPGDVIVTNNGNHVMFVMDVSGGNIYASAIPTPSSTKYNSLVWLLNNVYVAPKSTASSDEREIAAEYRELLLKRLKFLVAI